MVNVNDVITITRHLLMALGLEVESNSCKLVDQFTKNQLMFNGKFLKVNLNPMKPVYLSEDDICLEILNPKYTGVVEKLFGKFLEYEASEEMQNIPETLVYFFDKIDNKYGLVIKFVDGSRWIGNLYYNKILSYIEAIFSLEGTFYNTDLRPYDFEDQSVWEYNQ